MKNKFKKPKTVAIVRKGKFLGWFGYGLAKDLRKKASVYFGKKKLL